MTRLWCYWHSKKLQNQLVIENQRKINMKYLEQEKKNNKIMEIFSSYILNA